MNTSTVVRTGFISSILAIAFVLLGVSGTHAQANIPQINLPVPIPLLSCRIQVIKTVQGGTAVPGDFSVHVLRNGVDITGSPQMGSSAGTLYDNLPFGFYQVTETGGPAGYTATFSGDCDAQGRIGISFETTAVCRIHNVFTGTSTPPNPPAATSTNSTGGGTLSGTVVSPTSTTTPPTGGGGTLSGDVVAPNTLSGTVVAPSGGGSSGSSPSGGGNGPIAGSIPIPGGSGTPPGTVLGESTGPTTPEAGEAPNVPNTGRGGTAFPLLAYSSLIAIFGVIALARTRRI